MIKKLLVCLLVVSVSFGSFSAYGAEFFDMGFPDGFKSDISATTYERYQAYVENLPDNMAVYEPTEPHGEIQIFVAPDGKNSNSGKIDSPVATINRAVEILEGYKDRSKGAVIYLRGGDYVTQEVTTITPDLSGTADNPLYISAYNGEKVNVYGGLMSRKTTQTAANDTGAKQRLKQNVLDKVRVIDFRDTELNYQLTQAGAPTLKIDNISYEPARWPNDSYLDFAKYEGDDAVAGVISSGDTRNAAAAVNNPIPITSTFTNGFEFAMNTKRPLSWQNDGNIWIYGRMSVDWDWNHYQVDYFNPEIPSLKSVQPSWWGCAYTAYNDYYFLNVMEEIDVPGEMYVDNKNKKVYFYPLKEYSDSDEISVVIPKTLDAIIQISGAENCIINGINFIGASEHAVVIKGYKNIIQNCVFEECGGYAIEAAGKFLGFAGNKIRNSGGGIQLNASIVSQGTNSAYESYAANVSGTFIQNNYFEHIDDNGINISGVSRESVISHNTFNSVRDALIYGGFSMDTVIESNYSAGGAQDVADCGDYYYGGSSTMVKRNVFRYNVINGDTTGGCSGLSGIYLDDFPHFNFVYKNYLIDKRIKFNSGSENVAENNVLVGIDEMTKGSALENNENYVIGGPFDSTFTVRMKGELYLNEVRYGRNTENKYMYDFKKMNDIYENVKRYTAYHDPDRLNISEEEQTYRLPQKNAYYYNMAYNTKDFGLMPKEFGSELIDNYQFGTKDPGFVDIKAGNYDLKDDSAVYDKISGFEKLPSMFEAGYKEFDGTKLEVGQIEAYYPSDKIADFIDPETARFRWSEAFGATGYELIIASDKDFNNVVFDKEVKGCYTYYSDNMADGGAAVHGGVEADKSKLKDTLKSNQTYYWKVRAISDVINFADSESESQVLSFRVGTKRELLAAEEAETFPVNVVMNTFKTYMRKWLVEDDGTDYGFGVYKPGTIDELNARMEAEEVVIPTLKTEAEVQKEVEKISADLTAILTRNAIPYTRNIGERILTEYKTAGGAAAINQTAKTVSFTGFAQEAISDTRPLTPAEGIRFRMKIDSPLASWSTINLRAASADVSNPLNCENYFLCFSAGNIELQKIKNGDKANRIIHVEPNNDYIVPGEWADVTASATNTDEGVRVVMTIDGNTVFDYTDKENQVYDFGYAGFVSNNGCPPITVAPADN